MNKNKVILIGIDGATWRLIKQWANSQKLPAFNELIKNGVHCDLESTIPPISPSAWTSIFTGTNPGKHNIFGFVKRKENSYFVTPISSHDRNVPPIWRLISDCGKRCILLNIPFAYPPDKIKGIMTTGLGTPSKDSEFTYPKHYKKELLKQYPKYDVDFNEDLIELGLDKNPIQHIKSITGEQIRLTKHLFNNEPWDFFGVVFRSTDVIQHYYWKEKKVVFDCYLQIDKFLSWTLKNLEPNTLLIICSDHGFAPVHTCIYINNWLKAQNLFEIEPQEPKVIKNIMPSAETLQGLLLRLGCRNLIWKLKRSKFLETIIKRLVTSEKGQHLFDIKWSKTQVYFLEGSEAMLNINLKGREPQGIVTDNDWESLRQAVVQEIQKLTDPKSGDNVIKNAFVGDEVYKGEAKNFPDIIILTNDGYRLIGGYNYAGNIFKPEKLRFGEHEKNGIFIAYGSDLKKGKKLQTAKVYDIMPTILFFLKIAIPTEIDGDILFDAFKKRSIKSHMEKYEEITDSELPTSQGKNEKVRIERGVENLIHNGKL